MNYNLVNKVIQKQYFGLWWLDKDPERKLHGNLLIYSNGDYKLQTTEPFFEQTDPFSLDHSHFNVKGIAQEQQSHDQYYFKLKYCFSNGRQFSSHGIPIFKINVSYYLRSKTQKIVEFEQFNVAQIEILNLHAWSRFDGLEIDYVDSHVFSLKYSGSMNEKIYENELCKISIGNGYNSSQPYGKGFSFTYKFSFRIDFEQMITEEQSRDIANKLNWLLTLSCLSPTFITSFQLTNTESNPDYYTDLIYHDKFVDSSYKEKHVSEMILTYDDMRDNPHFFKLWIENVVDENPLLVKNLMGVLRNPNNFIENQFIAIISGVLTFAEQKLYSDTRGNIQLLSKLFEDYASCFHSFYKPTETTAKQMIKRRDILVHNSVKHEKTILVADDFRLNWFRTQLVFVSAALILRLLKFEDKVINERLLRHAQNMTAFEPENY